MPQEVLRQSNFNGGELAPQAVGRRDLKAYASSLALAVNMVSTAEGPVRRRGGLRHVDLIRNRLEVVAHDGADIATPNGGDGEGLNDGSGLTTTMDMDDDAPYVVAEFDFGDPVTVGLIDLTNFAFVEGGGGGDPGDPGAPPPPQYPWRDDRLDYLDII